MFEQQQFCLVISVNYIYAKTIPAEHKFAGCRIKIGTSGIVILMEVIGNIYNEHNII